MKTQVTYEILDDWIRKYAIVEIVNNNPIEYQKLKEKYKNQLLKTYEII